MGAYTTLSFQFSLVILSGFAYLFPHWIYICLFTVIPIIPYLLAYSLIPESASWLVTRDKHEKACKVMQRVAEINGNEAPSDLLSQLKVNFQQLNYLLIELINLEDRQK